MLLGVLRSATLMRKARAFVKSPWPQVYRTCAFSRSSGNDRALERGRRRVWRRWTSQRKGTMNTKNAAEPPKRAKLVAARLAVLLALLVSTLTFTGGASAALRTGVADDLGRYPDQSLWFLDSLGELGMSENRISVNFDPATPTTIPDQWQ